MKIIKIWFIVFAFAICFGLNIHAVKAQDSDPSAEPPAATIADNPDAPVAADENVQPEETAPPVQKTDQDQNSNNKKNTKQKTDKTTVPQQAVAGATVGGSGDQKNGFNPPPFPVINNFTGAATYTIPIEVPPGRNGLAPKIELTYNSYRGNSWVGVGWDLDLGSIQRSTKYGVNYNAKDFVVETNGSSEELVSGTTTWGANYYRAKIEESFSKYFYNGINGWVVTAKDGTRYYYGSTGPSRQKNALGVFKWCLDKIEDTNGNYLTISYFKDQGEIYPDRINYTYHDSLSYTNYVKFYLEDRSDKPLIFRTNSQVVTAKRLRTIEVRANDNPIRAYKLEYVTSASTARSVLKKIQEYGKDVVLDANGAIVAGSPLPANEFGWDEQKIHSFSSQTPFTTTDAVGWDAVYWAYGDFNGDGKTDILYHTTTPYAKRIKFSNGDGTFTDGPLFYIRDAVAWDAVYWAYGDFNGDGKTDILYHTKTPYAKRIKFSNGDGTFTDGPLFYITNAAGWDAFYWAYGDFNGDGRTDILYHTKTPYAKCVKFSNGDGTFTDGPLFYITNAAGWDTLYYWAYGDFNGDGRTDILYHTTTPYAKCIKFSNGDGTFTDGPLFYITNAAAWDALYWAYGDFNGDGKTDILYHTKTPYAKCIKFSNGDGTFTDGPLFYITNAAAWDALYWAYGDFNGDGRTDILYHTKTPYAKCVKFSNGDGTFTDGPLFYIRNAAGWDALYWAYGDFNGDGKIDILYHTTTPYAKLLLLSAASPDLLLSNNNGLGGSAAITYASSSNFQNDVLPFAVKTVATITTNDGLGNFSGTTYTYQGGLYNFAEREFRGFAQVNKTNPNLTTEKTWFKQTTFLQGRPYQTEFRSSSSALLSGTTLTWNTVTVDTNAGFVKLTRKLATQYDSMTVFTQEDNTYDDTNGNLLTTLSSGSDGITPPTENITKTNEYQNYGTSDRQVWRNRTETITGSNSGQVRQTIYDYYLGTGNLKTKSSWLQGGTNPTISMIYDSYGNVRYMTDARGNTTEIQYDSINTYPFKVISPSTNGVTHITQTEYNYLYGQPYRTQDENLNWTVYTYDVFGRLIQTDYPDGGQTVYQYFDNVFPRYLITKVKEDSQGNMIKKYEYVDGLGRSIQTVTKGEGTNKIVSRTFYDNMGRAWLNYGPYFASGWAYPQTPPAAYPWTKTTYDDRGRPVKIESPHGQYSDGIVTSYSYSGFTTDVTDPDGSIKRERKDYIGRIIRVREWLMDNGVMTITLTTYAYNAAGDLIKVTDNQGNITTLAYDTLGRKINMQDPDMGYWTYEYNPNSNLINQTDAKNQRIHFDYDELNRVTNKSYFINGQPSAVDSPVVYTYDLASQNGKGKAYAVTKGNIITTYNTYDKMGRNLSLTKTIDATNYAIQIAYDLSGKVTQVTYPDSQVVTQYYPGTGLVQSVSSGTTIYGMFTDYEPTGKVGQVSHANGIATFYTYDPWSTKLFGIVTEVPGGNPADALQDKSYHYTKAGDIYQIIDNKKGTTYTYIYDAYHRLKTETGPADPVSYTYNSIGNILTKTVGSQTFSYSYTYTEHVHAVSSITMGSNPYAFTYDNNGNMLTGPDLSNSGQVVTRTVTYNADNMPTRIVHPQATVDFVYDGNGTRTKKVVAGSTTYYISDGYEIRAGVVTKYIFGGTLRLAVIKGTETLYYHKDHLGSTAAVTNSSGVTVEASEYQPFGTFRAHSGNAGAYEYTDQELDNETNLYNYDARLYDPVIGRFVTPDSVKQDVYDPQTLNIYAYCRNNPLIYMDPSGHDFWSWYQERNDAWNSHFYWGDNDFISPSRYYTDYHLNNIPDAFADNIFSLGYNATSGILNSAARLKCGNPNFGDFTTLFSCTPEAGATIEGVSQYAAPWLEQAGGKMLNLFTRAPESITPKSISMADDAFVHITTKGYVGKIASEGLNPSLSGYVTKWKYVKDVTDPSTFNTMLYRQNLWPQTIGKFDQGAAILRIDGIPQYLGPRTNWVNGIPQWRFSNYVDPEFIQFMGVIE
jgi:RHS repeat-associated protein